MSEQTRKTRISPGIIPVHIPLLEAEFAGRNGLVAGRLGKQRSD